MNARVFVALLAFLLVGTSIGISKELTISEAGELALANPPDVKQAKLQLSLAELQLSSAQVKNFLLTLSLGILPSAGTVPQANLSAVMSFPPGTSKRLTGKFSIQPSPNLGFSWGMDFSLALDLANPVAAGEALANLAQALKDAQASLERTKATVIVKVTKGYFDLLSPKADQAVESKAEAEKNLKATEEKVSSGLTGDLDLLEAKLSLVRGELDYPQSREAYQAQKARFLRDYLGIMEEVELAPVSLDKDKLSSAAKKFLVSRYRAGGRGLPGSEGGPKESGGGVKNSGSDQTFLASHAIFWRLGQALKA